MKSIISLDLPMTMIRSYSQFYVISVKKKCAQNANIELFMSIYFVCSIVGINVNNSIQIRLENKQFRT